MGYVLPVDTNQYQNYHNRVTQPERDPYPIEKIYPAQLDMDYQKAPDNNDSDMSEWSETAKRNQSVAIPHYTMPGPADEIYAEMTGIGQNINKMI
ncbi:MULTISPECIES: hypothetical protein [Paraliobacillus]|uniref:hypothetical protein n=1 Tax=Paraliobacillus TaxID=200903 RepID=UPI000E3E68FA|nr:MULTISPECIES: hypothetical protein [Paraliobacillus]